MEHVAGVRQEWQRHWAVVLTSFCGMSLATVYISSTGPLMELIQRDLGWSRTQITSGMSIATALTALLGPAIGAAVDRYGSRRLAIPGVILYCGAIALLSLAHALWVWWALWALVGICSAGVKPTVWVTAVSRLFHTGRGLALAVMLCGTGIGSSFIPIAANALAGSGGWRLALLGLPLIWGAVTLPLVLLFMPRAAPARPVGPASATPARALPWDLLLTWRYQFILATSMIAMLVLLAFVFSVVPMLTGLGLSRGTAAKIAGSVGLMSIVGRLLTGWLMDRATPRVVGAIGMLLPAPAALILLMLPVTPGTATGAVVLVGLSLGAGLGSISYLISRYFGLTHFGLLFGIATSAMAITTGLGPLAASYSYDVTGSYALMLMLCVPLSVLCTVLLLALGAPGAAAAPAETIVEGAAQPN